MSTFSERYKCEQQDIHLTCILLYGQMVVRARSIQFQVYLRKRWGGGGHH